MKNVSRAACIRDRDMFFPFAGFPPSLCRPMRTNKEHVLVTSRREHLRHQSVTNNSMMDLMSK